MTIQRTSASRGTASPDVTGFYEPDTGSIQYVVSDPSTKEAAIIDAVWNFDPRNARTDTRSADEILAHVRDHELTINWILETHPHADHFMAAAYLKDKLGAPQAIGEKVREIAEIWRNLYHEPDALTPMPPSTACSPTATCFISDRCRSASCCRPGIPSDRSPISSEMTQPLCTTP